MVSAQHLLLRKHDDRHHQGPKVHSTASEFHSDLGHVSITQFGTWVLRSLLLAQNQISIFSHKIL